MLGVYNYSVLLTYFGMLTGFVGVTRAVDGDIRAALICLLIAGVCDMFDGAVASTAKRSDNEKRFGVQIDSLSDLVCFGVLPAIIAYVAAEKNRVSLLLAGLYLLSALIRLAWFNVDEEDRQKRESASRTAYLGLPVTTSALILPALFELGGRSRLSQSFALLVPLILLVMAVAFLVPFKLRKPQFVGKVIMLSAGAAEFALLLTRSVL